MFINFRQENVRLDFFSAFSALVIETKRIHSANDNNSLKRRKNSNSQKVPTNHENVLAELEELCVDIVKGVSLQIAGRSEPSVVASYMLLNDLADAVPFALAKNMHFVHKF